MNQSIVVQLEPMGHRVTTASGALVLDVIGARRVPLRFDCGGNGVCGKCRVIAVPAEGLSPPEAVELEHLSPEEIAEGWRLACQARVVGQVTVVVPEESMDIGQSGGKTGLWGRYTVEPLVQRIVLPATSLPAERAGLPVSIADWIGLRLAAAGDFSGHINWHAEVLRELSRAGVAWGPMSVVVHREHGVTAVLSGERPATLGAAVDIGTTTVACYVCDLTSGAVLATAVEANPQRRYGEDVISRIAYASAGHLDELRRLIVSAVDGLVRQCVETIAASLEDIDELCIVGNTTMVQIFAGFHPHSLGLSPYLPAVRIFPDTTAADAGLTLNLSTNVHIMPVVSGFIGADAVGAALAEAPWQQSSVTLIVDIGTNGELVLWDGQRLWATSCATGPAFEGAQISCGMRAVSGAIHAVELDHAGRIHCRVLGPAGTRPAGICGSGLIDAIAVLRRMGVLAESGVFNPEVPGVLCDEKGIGRSFALAAPDDGGRAISISLKDVRQFQLAKSALSVGIDYLLRHADVTRVARTVLTGAFGARFNWRNAVMSGMLPAAAVAGEVVAAENLAGLGAVMALVNGQWRRAAAEICKSIRFIELAADADFAKDFAFGTRFPALDEQSLPRGA